MLSLNRTPDSKYQLSPDTLNNCMDKDIFKDHADYWQIAKNIQDIYLSEGSLLNLLDFERVLDELDLYAFKNWEIGELVEGPDIGKYKTRCIFMWPEKLMPDPRGAKRLLSFDCDVKFMKTTMKIPMKIQSPKDYRPGTHKAKLMEKKVWLVEISMPKALMNDIRMGSIELEDQEIDLADLDQAYDEDLDQEQIQKQQPQQQAMPQQPPGMPPGAPAPAAPPGAPV